MRWIAGLKFYPRCHFLDSYECSYPCRNYPRFDCEPLWRNRCLCCIAQLKNTLASSFEYPLSFSPLSFHSSAWRGWYLLLLRVIGNWSSPLTQRKMRNLMTVRLISAFWLLAASCFWYCTALSASILRIFDAVYHSSLVRKNWGIAIVYLFYQLVNLQA